MDKLDFKKQDKAFYSGKVGCFDVLTVPSLPYLSVDGAGAPYGAEYSQALAALYPVSYALKFMSKKVMERDYVVGPLEGLWWADDMKTFITRDKAAWKWRIMIRQPDWITADHFNAAREAVVAKQAKAKDPIKTVADFDALCFAPYDEGLCVQVLHVGSYDDEGPILEEMHNQFIPENGLEMTGHHHEIYLSDPRRVAPEKLKTILRQPVRRV